MSFLSLEKLGGKPVELYVFQLGTSFWRYTDGRSAVTVNTLAYEPAVISRSATTDSHEEAQSTVTVTLDHTLPVVSGMLTGSPNYRLATLTIFRYQPGATDKALVARGRISSVRWRGTTVEVTFSMAASLLQQPVPRLTFLPTCNHVVYDAYCGIIAQDFTWDATVLAVFAQGAVGGSPDGPSFTVDASTNPYGTAGYFAAGYFRLTGSNEPNFIISHTAASGVALVVSMTALPAALTVGATLTLTAGCDGSIGTCARKFVNLQNFLGFPYMPTKNPFTQGLN
jgi:uncharacterized phage protein (TIGR02218 family)